MQVLLSSKDFVLQIELYFILFFKLDSYQTAIMHTNDKWLEQLVRGQQELGIPGHINSRKVIIKFVHVVGDHHKLSFKVI